MNSTELERGVTAVADAAGKASNPVTLFEAVSERLRQVVPFDGSAWFGMDPSTLLATAPARIENVAPGHCDSYWLREAMVEDVLLFRDLARTPSGVGTLHESTGDNPGRSARHREFLVPQGYDDELRAAFRTGPRTWGVVTLFRNEGRPSFGRREVEAVRQLGPALAGALRRFAAAPDDTVGGSDAPGTALFDESCRMLSLDAQAERWLAEIAETHWLSGDNDGLAPVGAVVGRAPAVAAGRERGPASARLQTMDGRWLILQASCLRSADGTPGPIALTIGPAKRSDIVPIMVEAYGLTPREQQITQALARGLGNQEIAASLHLSPHTVRDHLKAIFGKLEVGSRGELIAKLFAEHYGPALHDVDPEQLHAHF